MKRVWKSCASACLLGAIAVSGVATASTKPQGGYSGGSSTTVPEDSYYGLYYAVSTYGGYEISGANGASLPCGNSGRLERQCFVSEIDLATQLNLSPADSELILSQVGYDPYHASLLFSGRATGGVLEVWQLWRAPAPVPTSAELYAVSHGDEQTLIVNGWTSASLGTYDFTKAPVSQSCQML